MIVRTLNASLNTERPSLVLTATASFAGALLPCAAAGALPTPVSADATVSASATKTVAKTRRVTASVRSPLRGRLVPRSFHVALPANDVRADLVQRVEHRAGGRLEVVDRASAASHRVDDRRHEGFGGETAVTPSHLPDPSARSIPNGE